MEDNKPQLSITAYLSEYYGVHLITLHDEGNGWVWGTDGLDSFNCAEDVERRVQELIELAKGEYEIIIRRT